MSLRALVLGWMAVSLACAKQVATPFDQFQVDVPIARVERTEVLARLDEIPQTNRDRGRRLRELFVAAGCTGHHEGPDGWLEGGSEGRVSSAPPPSPPSQRRTHGSARLENIVCKLPGESNESIVVGAQYDLPKYGDGVVDNWSGVAMLPALYRALAARPRHHTFYFVGFTDTSSGRSGSLDFARDLLALGEFESLQAMVNVKGVGLQEPAVWGRRADPDLLLDLSAVASNLEQPLREVNFRRTNHSVRRIFPFTADAESFRQWGVRTITIHSFAGDSVELLSRSWKDTDPLRIDPSAYWDTYRMVAVYLGYLDHTMQTREPMTALLEKLRLRNKDLMIAIERNRMRRYREQQERWLDLRVIEPDGSSLP
ncbi:M28 family metallopeptidase [Myxococcota bacterium]|nr:M28 family metallopeptidase [Myxococcota bacterium]